MYTYIRVRKCIRIQRYRDTETERQRQIDRKTFLNKPELYIK